MWDNLFLGEEFFIIFYMFFLYSFFGWIYESCLMSVQCKSLVNRGFLNGPYIPIYGVGATLTYLLLWDYRHNILMVFVLGICMATILEYVTSFVMEMLFHTKWWDYSKFRFNINGRVCLIVSLFWGILILLTLHIFQPGVNRIINQIPQEVGMRLGYFIFALFITDLMITIIYTIKFRRILTKLYILRQEVLEYIAATKILETGEELKEKLSTLKLTGLFGEVRAIIDNKLHKPKDKLINTTPAKETSRDMEMQVKNFFAKYHKIKAERIHIRMLKAFPSMKVPKREIALKDLREKINKKGVRKLSKEFREEVTGKIQGNLSGFFRATTVGLLVLTQFALIIYLSYLLRGYTVYLYSIIQVLSIIIIIALVNDKRNASYKISWICIIAAFPITGHIMFMLWGNRNTRKLERKILEKFQKGAEYYQYNPDIMEEFTKQYPTKSRMAKYLESNYFPLFKNNKVEYYPMGEDVFEAIFEEIRKAEHFVLLNFFIVAEGVLWDKMHRLCLQKIEEGVKVLFLYDDFGGMLRTPKNFRRNLENEGFEVRVFNPIHKYTDKLYMNYRSHQKIIVVDGNVGFTGGMNLADEYVNLVQRCGVWKDNAVKVEGDAVWGLTVTFLQMWDVCSEQENIDYNAYRPTKQFEQNDVFCQVVSDGPANNPRNPIENIYKQIINYAKKVLYITTPYLIMEDDMRDALITAAKSGIDVRIITPFVPDKKNVKILTNYNYGRLLEAGVRIYEYTPGFIHAKTIISEDCGIVGTINMDYRSFHLHYECGVWMCHRETINTIKKDLVNTMDICNEITYENWKKRPVHIKVYQLFLNLFSTLM